MKLTIDAKALNDSTKRISLVMEPRGSIPILQNVLLTAASGCLSLYGTDMDKTLSDTIPATVSVEGAVTVNAKSLASLAAGFTAGSLVELEAAEDHLVIRNGRSSTTLPTLPVADMPMMEDKARPCGFKLAAATLLGEIDRVKHAISTEETRYYLNGIYWHRHKDTLRMVTTDGHRLALSDLPIPHPMTAMPGVIIPRDTVTVLRKLISGKGKPAVIVEVGDGQLRFQIGETVLLSKIIDGTFPVYQRVIPQNNGVVIEFARKETLAILNRLIKMGNVNRWGGAAIKFSAADQELDLSYAHPETGTVSDATQARVKGGPIQIAFNGRYMIDILNTLTGDYAEIHLSDPVSPVVIKEGTAQHVIMPMRL